MEKLRKTYSIEVVCENRSQLLSFDSLMKDVAQAIPEVMREVIPYEDRPLSFCVRAHRSTSVHIDVKPL